MKKIDRVFETYSISTGIGMYQKSTSYIEIFDLVLLKSVPCTRGRTVRGGEGY